MNNQYLLSFLLMLCIGTTLMAQDTVRISVADVTVSADIGQVCVPVIAERFDSIASIQFSLGWDADVLEYAGTNLGNNPLGLANDGFFTPTDSTWGLSFLPSGANGATAQPGEIILSICFNLLVDEGSSTINFGSYLSSEFVKSGQFVLLPAVVTGGSVTITQVAGLSVLPGDTNLDSLVNADDLLNIGLGFGQTGPARENASTNFSPQLSMPWANETPVTGVNYAHTNADGNGVVDALDRDVVVLNYGLSINEFTSPTIELNGFSSVPFIYLVSDTLTGGELASIDVFLGDEDNPVNVGYGLSFSLHFAPNEVDLDNLVVDFSESFLGSNLLTFNAFFPSEPGLLEIAVSRTDQQNSVLAGGKICTISLVPSVATSDYETQVAITPYRYINAAENATVLAPTISRVYVQNSSSTSAPAWARNLVVSPNPASTNRLNITGLEATFDLVDLLDLNGKLVRRYGQTTSLDISSIPSGTYLLRLTKANETVTRKVVLH